MATPLVLIQNTGAIDGATYADPDAVDDGKLAAFAADGSAKALDSAISGKFFLVEGGDTPIRTTLLDFSDLTIVKKAYEAPVKHKFVFSSIPVGPTDGETYIIKVIDLTEGFEPYGRFSAQIEAAESQSAADSIEELADALNDQHERPYVARSNKVDTITLTGTSGTATISIEGDDYTATFDTDLETTASNFVSDNKSAFDSNYGVALTSDGDDIVLTADEGTFDSPTIANASGDLDGSVANTQASDELIIEALENSTNLRIAKDFGDATDPTVTETTFNEGSGTPEQVKEAEDKGFTLHGDIYRETPQPLTPDSRVEDDGQYLLYAITATGDNEKSVNPSVFPYIVIAIESDTVTTDLDTFLGL